MADDVRLEEIEKLRDEVQQKTEYGTRYCRCYDCVIMMILKSWYCYDAKIYFDKDIFKYNDI